MIACEFPEHVYVENAWYDGPRCGIADVKGQPHRFVSQFDEADDGYVGTFQIWPVDNAELALEQEQWQIFVTWHEQYEAGKAGIESHPGHPGISKRWEELNAILNVRRIQEPENVKRAKAKMIPLERAARYASSGPWYQLAWTLL